MLFVNCLVDNPEFDSQVKERLTLTASLFGGPCEGIGSSSLIRDTMRLPGLVAAISADQKQRNEAQLAKLSQQTNRRRQNLTIPKLDDAELAGSSKASECTLILTEGESVSSKQASK